MSCYSHVLAFLDPNLCQNEIVIYKDIKRLHTPDKMAGVCDVKKKILNEDKSCKNFSHLYCEIAKYTNNVKNNRKLF